MEMSDNISVLRKVRFEKDTFHINDIILKAISRVHRATPPSTCVTTYPHIQVSSQTFSLILDGFLRYTNIFNTKENLLEIYEASFLLEILPLKTQCESAIRYKNLEEIYVELFFKHCEHVMFPSGSDFSICDTSMKQIVASADKVATTQVFSSLSEDQIKQLRRRIFQDKDLDHAIKAMALSTLSLGWLQNPARLKTLFPEHWCSENEFEQEDLTHLLDGLFASIKSDFANDQNTNISSESVRDRTQSKAEPTQSGVASTPCGAGSKAPGPLSCAEGPADCLLCAAMARWSTLKASTSQLQQNTPNINCSDSNVIYLVECRRCPAKYVGKSTDTLSLSFLQHVDDIENYRVKSVLGEHFNTADHVGVEDVCLRVLEVVGQVSLMEQRHSWWTWRLGSHCSEFGLNIRVPNPPPGVDDAKCKDGVVHGQCRWKWEYHRGTAESKFMFTFKDFQGAHLSTS